MLVELRSMGVSLETVESGTLVAAFHVRAVLVDRVRDLQAQDPYLMKLRNKIEAGQQNNFTVRGDGTLVLGQRLCVPDVIELKKEIMEEAHSSAYAMHPGSTKMYWTLKDHYWWRGMKREIAEFVSKCLTCQQIKIEHQKPAGLLQPLSIPEWKWERITMDFVTGLPKTQRGHDAIWVIVDRMTKSAHFIATNNYLSLIEFAYNNSYQSSIGMAPYEALYGRKCRTPVCWDEVGERRLIGLEIVQDTTEKVNMIRERLKIANDRQKSYADNRRLDLKFEMGDQVFLRVSPWKGILRFGKRGKLSPRYIGPYEIVDKVGEVAYRLRLPSELANIHDVFHVSMLRKYIADPSHILKEQPVQLKENLTYEEHPVEILDRRDQVLRNKVISLVKVLWRSHTVEEATWEPKAQMRLQYPHLFP